MKSIVLSILGLVLVASTAAAQSGTATLYSPNKYRNERRDFCLDFKTGVSPKFRDPCDLRYGFLYAGEDWDWFQGGLDRESRGVIKDLGSLNWDSKFEVPVVVPRRKLLPGEQRSVTVDTSGADGADGAPGKPGQPGADADGVVRQRTPETAPKPTPAPPTKKNDGVPKIDPIFVKAVVGHMYVARIVNNKDDFYVLFRVEEIQRGSSCVITWRMIDAPRGNAPAN
jgi:hypothetical protein